MIDSEGVKKIAYGGVALAAFGGTAAMLQKNGHELFIDGPSTEQLDVIILMATLLIVLSFILIKRLD